MREYRTDTALPQPQTHIMSLPVPSPEDSGDNLVSFLDEGGTFMFSSYERASMLRRIQTRMVAVNATDFLGYRAYIETHSEEHGRLCASVPVVQTDFFRDPEQWATAAKVVAEVWALKPASEPIRVWSAGCATGEEAYSLAILFAELGGLACLGSVRIHGTDISEAALQVARTGSYSSWQTRHLPTRLREKYFEPYQGRWQVRPELRRAVTFARHDLLRRPPLSGVDMLVCRNVLLYFTNEARAEVYTSIAMALGPHGVWFSGPADGIVPSGFFARSLPHRPFYHPKAEARPTALRLVGLSLHSTQLRELSIATG